MLNTLELKGIRVGFQLEDLVLKGGTSLVGLGSKNGAKEAPLVENRKKIIICDFCMV